MSYTNSHQANPSSRIFKTAIIVGSISFFIGSILLILLTDNNLSPLLGIFLIGPIGTFVGAVIGIVWSALHAGTRKIRIELWWLGAIWGISLLYFIFVINGCGLVVVTGALILQGIVVGTGIFLIMNGKVRRNLPKSACKHGIVILCAASLIVLTSIFPPVIQNKWILKQGTNRVSSVETLPKFASIQDHRLDARKQVPELTIAKGKLFAEWLAIALATGLVNLVIAVRIRRSNG